MYMRSIVIILLSGVSRSLHFGPDGPRRRARCSLNRAPPRHLSANLPSHGFEDNNPLPDKGAFAIALLSDARQSGGT